MQPFAPLARRHPEHPVRRPLREPQGRHVPAAGVSHCCASAARLPAAAGRHGAPGARDPALHRHPPAARASSCSAGSATTTRRAPSRPPTCSCRPPPARSRSASCCSRRWPPARRSCAATSTATRASSAAASRRCSCRRGTSKALAEAHRTLLRDPELRARMGAVGPRAAPPVRLGEHHRQGRGLLRLRRAARRLSRRAACPSTSGRRFSTTGREPASISPLRALR